MKKITGNSKLKSHTRIFRRLNRLFFSLLELDKELQHQGRQFMNQYVNYIDCLDEKGNTALISFIESSYASTKGPALQFVEILLNQEANINAQNVNGFTPLLIAISQNNNLLADFLIKKGADINYQTPNGTSPFYYALYKERFSIAYELWKNGCCFEYSMYEKMINENHAANPSFVQNPILISLSMYENIADKHKVELYNYLINNGVPFDVTSLNGNHLLFMSPNKLDLIHRGIDINKKHTTGRTILFQATYDQDLVEIQQLIELGAEINIQDLTGNTPLHHLLARRDQTPLKSLLQIPGVNNWFMDNDLSEITSDINLLYGSMYKMVKLLIKHGADLNIKNSNGENAYELALKWKINTNIIRLLKPSTF
ncbi:MAG: ankyrin repeat domain-containing protein [Bacteroidota bacterium]